MVNIMEECWTIKKLKLPNNIHTNNNKLLICFETNEEAQIEVADQKTQSVFWIEGFRHKIQKNRQEGQTETINSTEQKNRKKNSNLSQRHENKHEETIVIHNTDANKMDCYICELNYHRNKECQTKHNIYIVNLKKTLRSKLEIQE